MVDRRDNDAAIEAMIRAAGKNLFPSKDFRPRVLDAAHQVDSDQQAESRFGRLILAALLFVAISMSLSHYSRILRSKFFSPTSAEIQQRAMTQGALSGVGIEWGLADAFTELREQQAATLGNNQSDR